MSHTIPACFTKTQELNLSTGKAKTPAWKSNYYHPPLFSKLIGRSTQWSGAASLNVTDGGASLQLSLVCRSLRRLVCVDETSRAQRTNKERCTLITTRAEDCG